MPVASHWEPRTAVDVGIREWISNELGGDTKPPPTQPQREGFDKDSCEQRGNSPITASAPQTDTSTREATWAEERRATTKSSETQLPLLGAAIVVVAAAVTVNKVAHNASIRVGKGPLTLHEPTLLLR